MLDEVCVWWFYGTWMGYKQGSLSCQRCTCKTIFPLKKVLFGSKRSKYLFIYLFNSNHPEYIGDIGRVHEDVCLFFPIPGSYERKLFSISLKRFIDVSELHFCQIYCHVTHNIFIFQASMHFMKISLTSVILLILKKCKRKGESIWIQWYRNGKLQLLKQTPSYQSHTTHINPVTYLPYTIIFFRWRSFLILDTSIPPAQK